MTKSVEKTMGDSAVTVGSIVLAHPLMTASGTAGHGAELAPYGDLSALGAVVVKSLSVMPWAGNPAPRVHPVAQGMINAVGLQGPGVEQWVQSDLPALARVGARVVVSIWGRSVKEYSQAADVLQRSLEASPHGDTVVAVEVNLSCPNLEEHGIFAHDMTMSEEVLRACAVIGRPLWAKLSPNTDRMIDIARGVWQAGAEAVTLINTVVGMVLDPHSGRPVLGNGGGGISGRSIHPIAVRAVFDVHAALPDLPIVGVGGVTNAWEAAELMLAGASAVQVGTATFADPRACFKIATGLDIWLAKQGVDSFAELTGLAHRGGFSAT